jgi:hypothetical protein
MSLRRGRHRRCLAIKQSASFGSICPMSMPSTALYKRGPLAEVKKTYVFLPSAYFSCYCERIPRRGILAEGVRTTIKIQQSSLSPSALYLRIIFDDSEVYRSQSALFKMTFPPDPLLYSSLETNRGFVGAFFGFQNHPFVFEDEPQDARVAVCHLVILEHECKCQGYFPTP